MSVSWRCRGLHISPTRMRARELNFVLDWIRRRAATPVTEIPPAAFCAGASRDQMPKNIAVGDWVGDDTQA